MVCMFSMKDPVVAEYFLTAAMTNSLSTMPYEMVRLFTNYLPLKDSLTLHQCNNRLLSFLDYNHDPRLDNQLAVYNAFTADKVEVVQQLLSVKYIDRDRVLRMAAERGYESVVAQLLKDVTIEPSKIQHAFSVATFRGHAAVVDHLLKDNRVNPAADDNKAIRTACENGLTAVVQLLLLDCRVDPVARDNYAIKRAASEGHTEVVQILLTHIGVDVDGQESWAVKAMEGAVIHGHAGVMEAFLNDIRITPAMRNQVAMLGAAENGHVAVVELMLRDPDINPAALDNFALQMALQKGYTEIIDLLLNDPRVISAAAEAE
jgi:Ankyrin repeats (3 copies)